MKLLILCLLLVIPLSTAIKAETATILIDGVIITIELPEDPTTETINSGGDDDGIEPEEYPW